MAKAREPQVTSHRFGDCCWHLDQGGNRCCQCHRWVLSIPFEKHRKGEQVEGHLGPHQANLYGSRPHHCGCVSPVHA